MKLLFLQAKKQRGNHPPQVPVLRSGAAARVPVLLPPSTNPARGHAGWPKHNPVLVEQPSYQGPCSPPGTHSTTTRGHARARARGWTPRLVFILLTKNLLLASYLSVGYTWTQKPTNTQGSCLSSHLKFLPYTTLAKMIQFMYPSTGLTVLLFQLL